MTTPTEHSIVATHGLRLSTGFEVPDFQLYPGLNLIHASRETSATVLGLTLAGRMKPAGGTIDFGGATGKAFKNVALAGVVEIDSLERLVPVRVVIREQLAWSQPWYKFTPRSIENNDLAQWALGLVGLSFDDGAARHTKVGELDVLTRLRLRTALALIARPEAKLLIVDDIDQLRSIKLRHSYLESLREVAATIPVLVISANADEAGLADHEIRVAGGDAVFEDAPKADEEGAK